MNHIVFLFKILVFTICCCSLNVFAFLCLRLSSIAENLLLTLSCLKVSIGLSEKTGQGSSWPLRLGPGSYLWVYML